MIKFGFSVIVRGDSANRDTFDAIAECAEDLALDALWVSDHLVMPPLTVSRYPGSADGQLPEAWQRTYYQPFSVLNYLAAKTSRVRLGISVLILPMRNPVEVAAQVAELDQLSGGRVNLGIGVGWYQEEFEALGYNFADRGARTDDGLRVTQALWSDDYATVDTPSYKLDRVRMGPKPVQQPGPPIYIGGNSTAALRRFAEFGDVWHPFRMSAEDISATVGGIKTMLNQAGREAMPLLIAPKIPLTFQSTKAASNQAATQGRTQDIIDGIARYRDAGATEFCFDVAEETRDSILHTMKRFADEVRPHISND